MLTVSAALKPASLALVLYSWQQSAVLLWSERIYSNYSLAIMH